MFRVLCCSLLAWFALAQDAPPTGVWRGQGTQRNPTASWPIEVDFGSGGEVAKVTYPSLNCGGRLTRSRASVWIEEIDFGTAQCIERGRYIVLPVSANQLMLHYESLSPRAPDAVGRATLASSSAKPSPCGDGTVVDEFSASDERYHAYTVVTDVCSKERSGCSADSVFAVMLRDKRKIAPTRETGPVTACGVTNVRIPFFEYLTPSPIRTLVNVEDRRVVNYTLPSHDLHPGRVVRQVVDAEKTIRIWTRGEGTGMLPFLNSVLAPVVWEEVDEELVKAVLAALP